MISKLIAYSMDFSSFLIQKIKDKNKIRNIILFGSVAREEAVKNSDIDLFIDVIKEDKKIEDEINEILLDFVKSSKFKNYWELLGIESEIALKIGNLENWKELKPSIISNGILLYGKYKPAIKQGNHKTFFIWENIKPNARRVLLNKQLFGYKQNDKFYLGLLSKYNGERLGKGCILVPLEHSVMFHNLFKKYKANLIIKKIIEY